MGMARLLVRPQWGILLASLTIVVLITALAAIDSGKGLWAQQLNIGVTLSFFREHVCARGMGFWKHQYRGYGHQHIDDQTLESLLEIVRANSGVFDEYFALNRIEDANNILNQQRDHSDDDGNGHGDGNANKHDKALAQTLAAWLNFANDAVDMSTLIDTNDDSIGYMIFSDLIAEVESILIDPDATTASLEHAKDLAEAVNLSDEDNPDCTCDDGDGHGDDQGCDHEDDNGDDHGDDHRVGTEPPTLTTSTGTYIGDETGSDSDMADRTTIYQVSPFKDSIRGGGIFDASGGTAGNVEGQDVGPAEDANTVVTGNDVDPQSGVIWNQANVGRPFWLRAEGDHETRKPSG